MADHMGPKAPEFVENEAPLKEKADMPVPGPDKEFGEKKTVRPGAPEVPKTEEETSEPPDSHVSDVDSIAEQQPPSPGHENIAADKSQTTTVVGDSGDTEDFPAQPIDSFEAAGVRWAPLNVPLKRRLQTTVIMLHCLGIALSVSLFFLCCSNPLLWPLIIFYLINLLSSTAHSDGKLARRSKFVRGLPIWKLFCSFFPIRLHKTTDLPPTRKYIFGYHPHGIISHGAWAAFATDALGFSELFPGITNTLLTLDSNFRIPFYRDYVLSMGLGSVSKESIINILTKGGKNGEGMGRAVTIVIGGARESLEAQPGTMNLILKDRKGFIRMALRTGADLVPVLSFGENDIYDQLNADKHPRMRKFQMWALRVWKFTLPFLHGRGIFNYDIGFMPYRRSINVVVGHPIKVQMTPRDQAFDANEIDRLHGEYVAELQRLWDTYKDRFARNRKSEMNILG